MIADIKRGVPLPAVEDVARRLGIGADPASADVTFGEAWTAWLAARKGGACWRMNGWRRSASTGCCRCWRTCRWSGSNFLQVVAGLTTELR